MKTYKFIFLSLILFFSITAYSQKQPDVPDQTNNNSNNNSNATGYFKDDPDFIINFFGQTPSKNDQNVDTDAGKTLMTTYMYQEGETVIYMLAKAVYPPNSVMGDPDARLEKSISGFTGSLKLTVTEKKDIRLGTYPGKIFKASSDSYFNATADYLVKNVLYQIAVLRTDRMPTEKEVQDFIYSFSLK
jgi:hypothetical protein